MARRLPPTRRERLDAKAAREAADGLCDTTRLCMHADVPPLLAALVVLAAWRLGVPVAEFRADESGRGRLKRFCAERRHVSVLGRELGFSFPAIGRALNRDHSTIIHHVRRAQAPAP
jgi:hypothetical protein